jgi:hypothetical protein
VSSVVKKRRFYGTRAFNLDSGSRPCRVRNDEGIYPWILPSPACPELVEGRRGLQSAALRVERPTSEPPPRPSADALGAMADRLREGFYRFYGKCGPGFKLFAVDKAANPPHPLHFFLIQRPGFQRPEVLLHLLFGFRSRQADLHIGV